MPGIFSKMRLRFPKSEAPKPVKSQPAASVNASQSTEAPFNPSNHGPLAQNAQGGAGILSIRTQQAKTENLNTQIGKIASPKDIRAVWNMCREIHPDKSEQIFQSFWNNVIAAKNAQPAEITKRNAELDENWFHEPFYYLYPQYFGTSGQGTEASFDDLIQQLDYLEELGIRNLYILPHYESPMADGGYDVSAYQPRESLGGEKAYQRFMEAANKRGFRVVTDAPFNHTSVEHQWFRELKEGDSEKSEFYVRVDGREKIAEENVNGDIVCTYRDPDGVETKLVSIFPDVDRTHSLPVKSGDKDVNVFREFYPFQVDLDLRNPKVLDELFRLLGHECNDGVLGKRTDAIAHWLKRRGTTNDGLPETHALQSLFKTFLRQVSPKSIILPEAVRSAGEAAKYAGMPTEINNKPVASEGDALFAFELQGALREMIYFQTSTPFWNTVFKQPTLPENATWLNLLDHHDETYMGFIREENRQWLGKYIESKGGKVYKEGMSAGGRFADCLDNDPERIAMSMFCLYMTPGTPAVYYGAEIGAGNQPEHAEKMMLRQGQRLRDMGIQVSDEQAYDPRELQRGPISAKSFKEAQQSKLPSHSMVSKLNQLRTQFDALRSGKISPIDTGFENVLAMAKTPRDSTEKSFLSVANLSGEKKSIKLGAGQVKERTGFNTFESLKDYLTESSVNINQNNGQLEIELKPFQCLLIST